MQGAKLMLLKLVQMHDGCGESRSTPCSVDLSLVIRPKIKLASSGTTMQHPQQAPLLLETSLCRWLRRNAWLHASGATTQDVPVSMEACT